ncbi:MAG TPA: SDR family NAD(P)-dependent oxidoreductase [Acidimicrobiales bacterium]|jgi:NAD(P)-dependent dehydrogenase (short-subunit alcohol dehydrogenase family)|nr:SDR family NAD(P)-dependent oxidoreductase [Acidimicrobiales bacterium]
MGRLSGKVAFVTGAASGLGFACALRFAEEGAAVIGADLHETPDWAKVEAAASAAGFHQLDVRDEAAQVAAVETIIAAHGHVDVLVTAAGVAGGGLVHKLDLAAWQRVQDINLTGTFLSAKAVLPAMLQQRSGSIVTIASVEGLEGCEGGSTYNASKGAVVLLTKNLACDYGSSNIRANAICPGFIETPMFHAAIDPLPYKDAIRMQHKLGRFGRPEEIAGAALFLASDDASFVTGVALPVDGGYVAGHSYRID